MIYEMRRKKQQMSNDDAVRVLQDGKTGVLAVCGDNQPYAVPLNYVYYDSKIYFHCATQGRKLDEIAKNSEVSFCVVAQDDIVPEKFATRYRSVIAFGNARVLAYGAEYDAAIDALARKYSPDVSADLRRKEIEKYAERLAMVAVDISYLSGKQSSDLC